MIIKYFKNGWWLDYANEVTEETVIDRPRLNNEG